jgi:hypothetical protein
MNSSGARTNGTSVQVCNKKGPFIVQFLGSSTGSSTRSGENLPAREFENRLTDLYVAMRAQPLHSQPMTHEEVQELLPSYLAIEANGKNAKESYPLIHEHLQTCFECSAMYNRLKSALEIHVPQPRVLTLPVRSAKDMSEMQNLAL